MPIRSRRLGDSATRRLGGTRRGITLLEAVAAIAIVGMTAVGALEAVGGGMRTAERAKRAIEVEALATSRLEVMNLLTDQELQSLPDSIEDGKFAAPLDEYTWKATSAPVSDQAGLLWEAEHEGLGAGGHDHRVRLDDVVPIPDLERA